MAYKPIDVSWANVVHEREQRETQEKRETVIMARDETSEVECNYAELLQSHQETFEKGRDSRGRAWKPDPGSYLVQFMDFQVAGLQDRTTKQDYVRATPFFQIIEGTLPDGSVDEDVVGRKFSGESFDSRPQCFMSAGVLEELVVALTGEKPIDASDGIKSALELVSEGILLHIDVRVNTRNADFPKIYITERVDIQESDIEPADEDAAEDDHYVSVNESGGNNNSATVHKKGREVVPT